MFYGSKMIYQNRIKYADNKPVNLAGEYVLYWMEHSQRIKENTSLAYAIDSANKYNKPLLVLFVLNPYSPYHNNRHFQYMLQGLSLLRKNLFAGGIQLHLDVGLPVDYVLEHSLKAVEVVGDVGYLREERRTRETLKTKLKVPFTLIESEVIVPVEFASDKEEYNARTIRSKLQDKVPLFLDKIEIPEVKVHSLDLEIKNSFSFYPPTGEFSKKLMINHNVKSVSYPSGEKWAYNTTKVFLTNGLSSYKMGKNLVADGYQSGLSPFLHYGQISPKRIANLAKEESSENVEVFLEQLIVRRELAYNFVWYNQNYDSFESLPDWAKKTLLEHSIDDRPYLYTHDQLESAETHDKYWNAAMKELLITGMMNGYMRMYWGKKILEWVPDPVEAYSIALHLNNIYAIDGFNPNSYAGIAWCFGMHDRPWKTRDVFGSVRYMNAQGLERKYDMEAYLEYVDKL